jgi:hypothetical protein
MSIEITFVLVIPSGRAVLTISSRVPALWNEIIWFFWGARKNFPCWADLAIC